MLTEASMAQNSLAAIMSFIEPEFKHRIFRVRGRCAVRGGSLCLGAAARLGSGAVLADGAHASRTTGYQDRRSAWVPLAGNRLACQAQHTCESGWES